MRSEGLLYPFCAADHPQSEVLPASLSSSEDVDASASILCRLRPGKLATASSILVGEGSSAYGKGGTLRPAKLAIASWTSVGVGSAAYRKGGRSAGGRISSDWGEYPVSAGASPPTLRRKAHPRPRRPPRPDRRRLSADDVIHGAQFAAPGDTYGALTTQEQASATVHACLAAGIRWFDTAPLYTDCTLPRQMPMTCARHDCLRCPGMPSRIQVRLPCCIC